MVKFNAFFLLVVLALATAKQVDFMECTRNMPEESKCAVHKIRVDPCPSSTGYEICDINRSSIYLINVEYTPQFNGRVYGNVYYLDKDGDYLSLEFGYEVCKTTSCPIAENVRLNSTIALTIPDDVPTGETLMKVRLWNDNRDQCCALLNVNFHE